MAVNDQLGDVSYLGFQAAMAGYIAALVCFGIEFASARGAAPTPAEAVSMTIRAASKGRTAVMDRGGPAGGSVGHIGQIARPAKAGRKPMAALFGRAGLIVTTIGFVAQVFSIITRGIAAGRAPWGNMYEFTSLFCAAAVAGFLFVLYKTRGRSIGFFVMIPVVILMFVGGTKLYTQVETLVPALHSYWLLIHVLAVSLSSGVLMVSGVASVMYLLRARYERKLVAEKAWAAEAGHESGPQGDGTLVVSGAFVPQATVADRSRLASLPSLATLDRVAYRTAIVAFPVFTFAVIAGAMWAEVAWGRYWGWDPKETCAFVTWVFYAAYLHARATAGWRGSKAAWISVLGFVSVLFNLFFINIVVSGLHSYAGLN